MKFKELLSAAGPLSEGWTITFNRAMSPLRGPKVWGAALPVESSFKVDEHMSLGWAKKGGSEEIECLAIRSGENILLFAPYMIASVQVGDKVYEVDINTVGVLRRIWTWYSREKSGEAWDRLGASIKASLTTSPARVALTEKTPVPVVKLETAKPAKSMPVVKDTEVAAWVADMRVSTPVPVVAAPAVPVEAPVVAEAVIESAVTVEAKTDVTTDTTTDLPEPIGTAERKKGKKKQDLTGTPTQSGPAPQSETAASDPTPLE